MKHIYRLLSVLVFALTIFCGFALVRHVSQLPDINVRYALVDITDSSQQDVQRESSSWNLSKLSLIPQWTKKRDLISVMVENHEDARPYHRGLEDAVLIEEFFVEGFISRLNAIFDIKDLPKRVGPVRSLRPYFVEGALPWASAFFHIGGSPEALECIEEYNLTSFNGIYRDTYYMRQEGVPMPHDAFLEKKDAKELLKEVEELTSVDWPPYKTGRAKEAEDVNIIRINYFSPFHNVEYVYDSWKRRYIRENGKELSVAEPRNVLILEAETKEIGPFGRLSIKVQGEGKALLFRSGMMYPGWWSKEDVLEPYVFTDESDNPLVFASGQTWITVVDDLVRVKWE